MVNLQHSFKMNEETLGISEKESEDLRGMFVHTVWRTREPAHCAS